MKRWPAPKCRNAPGAPACCATLVAASRSTAGGPAPHAFAAYWFGVTAVTGAWHHETMPDPDGLQPTRPDLLPIRDRRELAHVLEIGITWAYRQLREQQRLLFGQNLTKTYLLELDGDVRAEWGTAFRGKGLTVLPSADGDLLTLYRESQRRTTALFAERISDRFIACHSLAPANDSDAAIYAITRRRYVDSLWLSSAMLENVASLGAFRGFTTRFQDLTTEPPFGLEEDMDEPPDGADLEPPRLGIASLRLRLSGRDVSEVLRTLRTVPALSSALPISSVRIRYRARGEPDFFTLDELSFTGRLTARGTSYEMHRNLVERLIDVYRQRLEFVEEHRIHLSRSGVAGEPFVINLIPGIYLPNLIDTMFRGNDPFRLVGIAQPLGDDYWTISAVDLHSGGRLDFELSPTTLRIYLQDQACGNSVLRLESNLQRYLQGSVALKSGLQQASA